MKYIKVYERKDPFQKGEKADVIKLKPGYMYKHFKTPVCFLGNIANDSEFTLLCLIFEDRFEFIEWVHWMDNEEHLPSLDMTIRDYIIENKLIRKTMKALEKPRFCSGGDKNSLKKIKKLKEEFLNDEELMNLLKIEIEEYKLRKAANKYNL